MVSLVLSAVVACAAGIVLVLRASYNPEFNTGRLAYGSDPQRPVDCYSTHCQIPLSVRCLSAPLTTAAVLEWLQDRSAAGPTDGAVGRPPCLSEDVAIAMAGSTATALATLKVLELWTDNANNSKIDLGEQLMVSKVERGWIAGRYLTFLNYAMDRDGAFPKWNGELWNYGLTNSGRKTLTPGELVLDIGGNIGFFAAAMIILNPGVRVVSIEPSPENRFYYELNIAMNDLAFKNNTAKGGADRPRGVAIAGTDNDERVIFHSRVDGLATNLYGRKDDLAPAYDRHYLARTATLEAVLADAGVADARVAHLKIDCEGCEFEVVPRLQNATLDLLDYVGGEIHLPLSGMFDKDDVQRTLEIICGRRWNMYNFKC